MRKVFGLSTSGIEKVLHSFKGGSDGAWPAAALVNVKGTLYGTTEGGGIIGAGSGTVFSISTDGRERVLHAFTYGSDGGLPAVPLIDVNGTLYGTTVSGGKYNAGTAYSITTNGSEKVLHSFGHGSDGSLPASGLTNVNGTLYGTTPLGGTGCYSCGTVYSVTTSGTEKVLYRFTGRRDGAFPKAGLINVKGTLYGATSSGGGRSCGHGCRTIYSLTTSGSENVLYRFENDSQGEPRESLLYLRGVLYGTTPITRGETCVHTNLCGTAFAFTL